MSNSLRLSISLLVLSAFSLLRPAEVLEMRASNLQPVLADAPVSPVFMDPAIMGYAKTVRAALANEPNLWAQFENAYGLYCRADASVKEYAAAQRNLKKIAKNKAWRGVSKEAKRAFNQLLRRLRPAVNEFVQLRPFVIGDPRQNAAALLRQQRHSRRVAKVAIALATIVFGGIVLGGAARWWVKENSKPTWVSLDDACGQSTNWLNRLKAGFSGQQTNFGRFADL